MNHPGDLKRSPPPLVLGDSDVAFWARGWTFHLRKETPVRLERLEFPRCDIDLRKLPGVEDHPDKSAFDLYGLIGPTQGANPRAGYVLHSGSCGHVTHEDTAMEIIDAEESRNWIELHLNIPFYPTMCHPPFVLEQGDKFRPIRNVSKEEPGLSLNSSRNALRRRGWN